MAILFIWISDDRQYGQLVQVPRSESNLSLTGMARVEARVPVLQESPEYVWARLLHEYGQINAIIDLGLVQLCRIVEEKILCPSNVASMVLRFP